MQMEQAGSPEEALHEVDWTQVGKHFGAQFFTFMCFFPFYAVGGLPLVVSLPHYTFTFLVAFVLMECLAQQGTKQMIAWGVASLLACGLGGYLACGLGGLGVAVFLQGLVRFGVVLMLLVVGVLNIKVSGFSEPLQQSTLWQAIIARRSVFVCSQMDLTLLMKALSYQKAINNTPPTIVVGMVEVDTKRQDLPDLTLELSYSAIEPGKYALDKMTRFYGLTVAPGATAPIEDPDVPMKAFRQMLKNVKKVTDKMLDRWLSKDAPPEAGASISPPKGAAPQAKSEQQQQQLHKWFYETKFPEEGGTFCVQVSLVPVDRVQGLKSHWAVELAQSMLVAVLFALPAVHAIKEIMTMWNEHCPSPPKELELGGIHLCGVGLGPCSAVCTHYFSFAAAMHDVMGISWVELLFCFFLIPVCMLSHAVSLTAREHNAVELIYLRSLRESKKAVREVLTMQSALESCLSFGAVVSRFWSCYQAWMGLDPELTACGPITEAEFDTTASKAVNECFKWVMEPISSIRCKLSNAKSDYLLFGFGIVDWARSSKDDINNGWAALKYDWDLGSAADRNYVVHVNVEFRCKNGWYCFKDEFLKKSYKEQLEYACNPDNTNAQDSGNGTHLKVNTTLGDNLLPRGFSLTHVYVQAMPEDGAPFQVEIGGEGITEVKDVEDLLASLEKGLKARSDDDPEDYIPDLDKRIEQHPITVRFALSENYFTAFKKTPEFKEWFPQGGDKPQEPQTFTNFVDFLFTPVDHKYAAGAPPVWTRISVFMGDSDPLKALLASLKELVWNFAVLFQCLVVALLIPALRKMMQGKDMFPAPFVGPLLLNTVFVWVLLVLFFEKFNSSKKRLSVIASCLAILEECTLAHSGTEKKASTVDQPQEPPPAAPAAPAVVGALTAAGAPAAPAVPVPPARPPKKGIEAPSTKPFDLYVPNDPNIADLVEAVNQKHRNVGDWQLTSHHLRVFVSTSRLTAAGMLVSAGIILGCLILLSLVQAMNGAGPINVKMATEMAEAVKEHASHGLEAAKEQGLDAAQRLGENIGEAKAKLAGQRLLSGAEEPLASSAARRLHEALTPVHTSLRTAIWDQLETLDEAHHRLQLQKADAHAIEDLGAWGIMVQRRLKDADVEATLKEMEKMHNMLKSVDVTKATKTQLLTLSMIFLIMIYSVPLMWHIVRINGFFDRHEDLLVKAKSQHRKAYAKIEDKVKQGAAAPAEGESAPTPAALPTEEVGRYEKLLDTAIEDSKKVRERFPLKLFGFVISMQFLSTWIFLASGSLTNEVKKVAPGFAMMACEAVETSKWVKALQNATDHAAASVQQAINSAADQAQSVIDKAQGALGDENAPAVDKIEVMKLEVPKLRIANLIHENICQPLKTMLAQQIDEATAAAQAQLEHHVKTVARRRLRDVAAGQYLGNLDVVAIVNDWWASTPGHPGEKFWVANFMLKELHDEVDRMLVRAPARVIESLKRPGEQGLVEAVAVASQHVDGSFRQEGRAWQSMDGALGRRASTEL